MRDSCSPFWLPDSNGVATVNFLRCKGSEDYTVMKHVIKHVICIDGQQMRRPHRLLIMCDITLCVIACCRLDLDLTRISSRLDLDST